MTYYTVEVYTDAGWVESFNKHRYYTEQEAILALSSIQKAWKKYYRIVEW